MMPGTKDFYFRPSDLVNLLTHYTDGEVPMNAEVTDFLLNPHLGRVIGLMTMSDEWQTSEPLHVRYDGKRIAAWAKSDGEMIWEERNETPGRQN